jgi:transcriptional regulator with XRE-family HTH domain
MRVTFQKLLRVAAGYSQQEIADLLGVDPSLVSRYESGGRKMPKALKRRFVAACAKRVSWEPLIRQAQKS